MAATLQGCPVQGPGDWVKYRTQDTGQVRFVPLHNAHTMLQPRQHVDAGEHSRELADSWHSSTSAPEYNKLFKRIACRTTITITEPTRRYGTPRWGGADIEHRHWHAIGANPINAEPTERHGCNEAWPWRSVRAQLLLRSWHLPLQSAML